MAAVSPLLLRPILRRLGIFDVPNGRSSHDRPIMRAGGTAQLLGILVAGIVVSVTGASAAALVVLGCGVAAGFVGFGDDLRGERGLGIPLRAGLQLLVGAFAGAALALVFDAPVWSAVLGSLFVAAYVNIANFMDGINGISALHGFVVGLALFAIGATADRPWLQQIGLLLSAVFIVFLPWNTLGARMFLGDVGSYLLGGLIGASVLAAVLSGIPVVVAASPISIYLADTLTTLARRAARGEPVLRAHRTHAYQRLTDTGLTHLQTSALTAGFSGATAIVGLLVLAAEMDLWVATLLIALVCAMYLAIPRLRGSVLPKRPIMGLKAIEAPVPNLPREGFDPTRWAVIGASGFVGSALAAELDSRGMQVLRVSAPRLRLSPTDDAYEVVTEARAGDDHLDLVSMLRGTEVVINAAGLATPDAPADESLYGANALLPAVVAIAAHHAGTSRVVHLSSAAVQGHRSILDDTLSASPFSPYSHSKALGERAFLAAGVTEGPDLVIVRATSVQGPGRRTTTSFRRIARSPLASVAAPGTQPTVVSSIYGLVDFVLRVATSSERLSAVLLQPWEGYSVHDVLQAAGGRPRVLPRWLCVSVLSCARAVGRVVPEVAGAARRLEMMWLGQAQIATSGLGLPAVPRSCLESVLAPASGDA